MHDSLSLTVIDSFQQLLQIGCSSSFIEPVPLLLAYLVLHLHALNVLRNQVHVLAVIIGLKTLHDIWMIKLIQNCDFFHDLIDLK